MEETIMPPIKKKRKWMSIKLQRQKVQQVINYVKRQKLTTVRQPWYCNNLHKDIRSFVYLLEGRPILITQLMSLSERRFMKKVAEDLSLNLKEV